MDRKQGFIASPKVSENGNLTFVIGPLGGPVAMAPTSELLEIKRLYAKYCPGETEPNIWEVCRKILCTSTVKITKEDLKEIRDFIQDYGSEITTSYRVIDCVLASLREYCELKHDTRENQE